MEKKNKKRRNLEQAIITASEPIFVFVDVCMHQMTKINEIFWLH